MRLDFLNQADDLPRKNDGQQGIGDPFHRDIAQREPKNRQITDEIDSLDGNFQHMGQAHGKGVISTAGSFLPDDQSHANTDETGAKNGSNQRMSGQIRKKIGTVFPDSQEKGKAAGGCQGTQQKNFAEK